MARRTLPLVFCFILSSGSLADTYTVAPDGSGDFPTIQVAIDSVLDGDVIELLDGIFVGQGNRDIWWAEKSITLKSRNDQPEDCVIDCQGSSSQPHSGITIVDVDPTAYVEGITVSNACTDDWGGGLILLRSAVNVQHCIFAGNRAYSGGGVNCDVDSYSDFHQCTFWDNEAFQGGAMCI